MGKIIKENKKLLTVQKYVRKKRKWINTTETAQWRKNKCNEIKIIIDSIDNINRVEIIKNKKETNPTNTTTEITKNNSNTQEEGDKAPVGLWHLCTGPEARMYIKNNAKIT